MRKNYLTATADIRKSIPEGTCYILKDPQRYGTSADDEMCFSFRIKYDTNVLRFLRLCTSFVPLIFYVRQICFFKAKFSANTL